jgi:hypothetical protein
MRAARARQGRLVLFTGSGIGLPAGLPDWRLLLRDLAKSAGMDDAAAGQLVQLDVLDQAAILSRRLGAERLADEVAARLDVPHHALAHGLLAGLPVTEHVTVNYDRLHEIAAEAADERLAVLPYEPAQDRWLLKLHGCVQQDRRHDIVLTRADYLSLGQHRAILTGLVQALLVARHMLFVGFGLTDPHLHAVLHDVRRALGHDRQDRLGTALVLSRDELQEELWRDDLDLVAMGGTVPEAARRLELFLDLVLLLATTSDAHLFDPAYVDLLTDDERELRDALQRALGGITSGASPAWGRVTSLLSDLGWRNS